VIFLAVSLVDARVVKKLTSLSTKAHKTHTEHKTHTSVAWNPLTDCVTGTIKNSAFVLDAAMLHQILVEVASEYLKPGNRVWETLTSIGDVQEDITKAAQHFSPDTLVAQPVPANNANGQELWRQGKALIKSNQESSSGGVRTQKVRLTKEGEDEPDKEVDAYNPVSYFEFTQLGMEFYPWSVRDTALDRYIRLRPWIFIQDAGNHALYELIAYYDEEGTNKAYLSEDGGVYPYDPDDSTYDQMYRDANLEARRLREAENERPADFTLDDVKNVFKGNQGVLKNPVLGILCLGVAVAEVRRNWVTALMNPMLLQLIESGEDGFTLATMFGGSPLAPVPTGDGTGKHPMALTDSLNDMHLMNPTGGGGPSANSRQPFMGGPNPSWIFDREVEIFAKWLHVKRKGAIGACGLAVPVLANKGRKALHSSVIWEMNNLGY